MSESATHTRNVEKFSTFVNTSMQRLYSKSNETTAAIFFFKEINLKLQIIFTFNSTMHIFAFESRTSKVRGR